MNDKRQAGQRFEYDDGPGFSGFGLILSMLLFIAYMRLVLP